jgi:hypothetical protein
MTVETLYCAVCGQRTAPDTDHVELDAEAVRMNDRNGRDEYVLHVECWQRLSEGWAEPV